MVKDLEKDLIDRGISNEIRSAIHNSKICIIDDQIEHLRSLTDGLRKEGFTNIVEKNCIDSINNLIEGGYELIILDLANVATEICENDGLGVLSTLHATAPTISVLVVTGTKPPPDMAPILSKADLIRTKPVKSADLANDVEQILKTRKDPYWAGISILKELVRIHDDLFRDINLWERILLIYNKQVMIRKIKKKDESLVLQIKNIANILSRFGVLTIQIIKLAKGF